MGMGGRGRSSIYLAGIAVVAILFGMAGIRAVRSAAPAPTPTATVAVAVQALETETPEPTETSTETATVEPSATATETATATSTKTATATRTPKPPTETPEPEIEEPEEVVPEEETESAVVRGGGSGGAAGAWSIEIPGIGVSAPIVTVGWDADGAIGAPNDPDVVGWFQGGAYPGNAGNAILDGHRDWAVGPRPAVFWSLSSLGAGAPIYIYDHGTTHEYAVFRNVTYAYDDPAALEVIAPSSEPIITLITCDGAFDPATNNYALRTVIQARLVASY